jgi:hypothetical protein
MKRTRLAHSKLAKYTPTMRASAGRPHTNRPLAWRYTWMSIHELKIHLGIGVELPKVGGRLRIGGGYFHEPAC